MKGVLPVFMFFAFFLLSCSGKKDNIVITYQLGKSDYVEKITIPGTVQAVVNTPVMPPRVGQMTVVRLAKDGEYVKKGDTICVLSAPELVSNYQQMLTTIETLGAELERKEADNRLNIALLESQLATSEAQLKISNLDSLRMKYATDAQKKILALEMERASVEKKKTERKLAAAKKIGEADITRQKLRISQAKVEAQRAAEQISSLILIAQREGMVQREEAPIIMLMSSNRGSGSFGGPIKEGSVLMFPSPVLKFPDLSRMQISADASESDFRKVERGQKVIITVDAAEKLETTGRINRKSLATTTAQRYSSSKVRTYEVIVDVDSCHLKMKPGLSASCEIIIQQVKDTLFVPTLSIFEKDSLKIVYIQKRNKFIPVEVKTGSSGSSYTIITGGLSGDEIIAITEPPLSLINDIKALSDTTINYDPK
jgi:HlyD family secretion protein